MYGDPTPKRHVLRRSARLLFGFYLTVGLAYGVGCGFEAKNEANHPSIATGGIRADVLPPFEDPTLVPPSSLLFDAVLDPSADPEAIALALDLELISAVSNEGLSLALFAGQDEGDLASLAAYEGVVLAGTNEQVDVADGQTLVLGFYEGEWDEGAVGGQDGLKSLSLADVHGFATGKLVRIAVLDTGCDLEHPWLQPRVEPLDPSSGLGSEESADGIDQDADGEIDEGYGHGTHVAGCVATVAPDAVLIPIRVLNSDGIGSLWDVLRGIDLARTLGADIVNLSFSLSNASPLLDDLLIKCEAEGMVVVSAAGNHGRRYPVYPAVSPLVVGVSAVDEEDYMTIWAGGGSAIPLAAPGVHVLSAYPRGQMRYGSGTSMATPLVSGAIALTMDGAGVTAREAVSKLEATAVSIHPAIGVEFGRIVPMAAIAP